MAKRQTTSKRIVVSYIAPNCIVARLAIAGHGNKCLKPKSTHHVKAYQEVGGHLGLELALPCEEARVRTVAALPEVHRGAHALGKDALHVVEAREGLARRAELLLLLAELPVKKSAQEDIDNHYSRLGFARSLYSRLTRSA